MNFYPIKSMKLNIANVLLVMALCICAQRTLAQSFSIDHFVIAGGGGSSTGGTYAVHGTIGQPDAGAMSGGTYSLVGDLWGAFAVQAPGAPLLSIVSSNGAVFVSCILPAPGWVLDQTLALTGTPPPWTLVPFPYMTNATTIRITVPVPSGTRFYRLRHP